MDEYRKLRDKLEYEAMVKNPETAYLVSNEEFDKKLDELGIAPSDMATMAGMYVERSMYNLKKSLRNMVRELLELLFAAAALLIDTLRTFFLIVLSILGPIAILPSPYGTVFRAPSRNGSQGISPSTCGCPWRTCSVRCWQRFRS